jgi:hypothetical protein
MLQQNKIMVVKNETRLLHRVAYCATHSMSGGPLPVVLVLFFCTTGTTDMKRTSTQVPVPIARRPRSCKTVVQYYSISRLVYLHYR